jgi:triacylglycerol esterase/lipase EstA (alpha/beta hydrolase family)
MRRAIAVLLTCLITLTLGGAVSAAPASAGPKYPVPYGFLLSAVAGGAQVDPPGANNFACKPSAAHPRPVILLHGILGNKSTNWQTYAPLLANNGYCVFSLTYGQSPLLPAPANQLFGGLVKMEQSSLQVKAFVTKVLKATKAKRVDIVGHSEGTVVPDYYVKYRGGAKYVDHYISLAPLWHGTDLGGLAALTTMGAPFGVTPALYQAIGAVAASTTEFLAGSEFMTKLRAGGTPAVKGVHYTNIVTKYDELVQPYTSGIQTGMTNYVVQNFCATDYSEHFEIAADPVAAQLVLNTLDPKHKHAVPCRLVLPFVGGS